MASDNVRLEKFWKMVWIQNSDVDTKVLEIWPMKENLSDVWYFFCIHFMIIANQIFF